MKLLVLSESANHVSCRYRVRAFEPALHQAGWEVFEHPVSRSVRAFVKVLREAAASDAVLVQRRLLSVPGITQLRRCADRLIYDFDDAVFLRDSNSTRRPECRRRRWRFRAMVAAADVIIAGNRNLAESAARISRDALIETIPTCVDPDVYCTRRSERRGSGLRLAWIGSSSTLPSLIEIGPALREAARFLPGLELHVICNQSPDLPGVKVVLHRWSPETELTALSECDVGVSWLPVHPWSRGKCGLKVLQYMAAGLPVLANPVGVHRQMVTPEVNGVIVDAAERLPDALMRLAESPALRTRMGRAGRRRVRAEFSVQAWSAKFVAIVREAGSDAHVVRAG